MQKTKNTLHVRRLWISAGILCILSAISVFAGDKPVLSMIINYNPQWAESLPAKAIAQLGKAWIILWLVAVYVWRAGFTRHAAAALLSLVMILAICSLFKVMVHRPRPETVILGRTMEKSITNNNCHSFPSGDTATAFAAATVCVGLLSWPQLIIAFAASGYVGLHRMILIRHYFSDVLAGAAIGIACGILAMEIVRQRLPEALFRKHVQTSRIIGLICAIVLIPLSCLETYRPLVKFLMVCGIPTAIIIVYDIIRKHSLATKSQDIPGDK